MSWRRLAKREGLGILRARELLSSGPVESVLWKSRCPLSHAKKKLGNRKEGREEDASGEKVYCGSGSARHRLSSTAKRLVIIYLEARSPPSRCS